MRRQKGILGLTLTLKTLTKHIRRFLPCQWAIAICSSRQNFPRSLVSLLVDKRLKPLSSLPFSLFIRSEVLTSTITLLRVSSVSCYFIASSLRTFCLPIAGLLTVSEASPNRTSSRQLFPSLLPAVSTQPLISFQPSSSISGEGPCPGQEQSSKDGRCRKST